ncbi:MAG: hypothetical protein COA94_02395 [Rickettsiales bacterium]|nr:MAG: hypothetical protein COA94_02395 [Rickettsiales bacterium]
MSKFTLLTLLMSFAWISTSLGQSDYDSTYDQAIGLRKNSSYEDDLLEAGADEGRYTFLMVLLILQVFCVCCACIFSN